MLTVGKSHHRPLVRSALALLLTSAAAGPLQAQEGANGDVLPRPAAAFSGVLAPTIADSRTGWPAAVRAPAGAPNILLVMTDDVGFAASSTFGGPVPTPNLDRLAAKGLRYNNFHTTAICSPSRAALLTGRNHHAVSTGFLTDAPTGYPGYTAEIPDSAATVAEVLRQNGYNTAFIGKHHNVPPWQRTAAGPFDNWPTGLGFEYFFGFVGGDSDQWNPRLFRGVSQLEDAGLEPGETLDHAFADDAIHWLRNQNAADPNKPFLLYLAPGTAHAPHQVPRPWLERFRGKFDQGWDKMREESFARQKKGGIIPASAKLTPRPAQISAWDSLTPEEKRVHARLMEAAAATLAYQDAQIGRVLDEIDRSGETDNTLIIFIEGDNGGSGEAGNSGTSNEMGQIVNEVHDDAKSLTASLEEIGGPRMYQNYSVGWAWAMNTPFQWAKQVASHLGGITNGMVVSWPRSISQAGQTRGQFAHLNDITPTILEAAGVVAPSAVNGVKQQPIDGISLKYSFNVANAPERHRTQYFEITANRAIYHDGWFANSRPRRMPWESVSLPGRTDTSYEWELYNLRKDYSQAADVSKLYPEKLAEMKALFDAEAKRNSVYPLDDRFAMARTSDRPPGSETPRTNFHYWGKNVSVAFEAAPPMVARSFRLTAKVKVTKPDQTGVLAATGSWFGGWSFYLKDGRPVAIEAVSQHASDQYRIAASKPLDVGPATIDYVFTSDGDGLRAGGVLGILVNGEKVAEGRIERTILRTAGLGETFDIGRDTGVPVTDDYPGNGAFPGDIEDIEVDLGPVLLSRR